MSKRLVDTLRIDLNTKEGLLKAMEICPNKLGEKIDCTLYIKNCNDCVADYLFKEVSTKKRLETYKTEDGSIDFNQAYDDFFLDFERSIVIRGQAKSGDDVLYSVARFAVSKFIGWLLEDVEVEK